MESAILGCNQRNYLLEDNEIVKKISDFLYSNYYFLILIAVVFISWVFNLLLFGIITLVLIATFIMVIQRDITPIMPLIAMAFAIVSKNEFPSYFKSVMCLIVVPLSGVIFHFVYYRNTKFYFGKLGFSLFLIFIMCLLSGVGSKLPRNNGQILPVSLFIAFLPFFVYMLLINFANMPEDKSIVEYFARAFLFFGLLVFLQLAINYLHRLDAVKAGSFESPHLGWAVSNGVAAIFQIVFPMGFYMYLKSDSKYSILYMIAALVEFFGIVLTTSRGGLIFGTMELVAGGIVVLIKADSKKRKETLIFAAALFVLGIIAILSMFDKMLKLFNGIFHDGFNDSGRLELYREAIGCFIENPIFGAGLTYIGKNTTVLDQKGLYQFHNTILQIVGSMGFVGLIVYMYNYYVKFEILLEKFNLFNIFIFVMFIGFEGYAMLDTGTIQGYPFGTMVVLLIGAVEKEEKQEQSILYSKAWNFLTSKLKKENKLVEEK